MGDRYRLLDDLRVCKLDSLPKGWKYANDALTQPNGWRWAHNGKSIFSGERKTALVREVTADGDR